MAPVLSLSSGLRVGPSTLTSRAATTLHSSATATVGSQPVGAPRKSLRPGLVASDAHSIRGRRSKRVQAVSTLLSLERPEPEADVCGALGSTSLADVPELPGLWPPIDANAPTSPEEQSLFGATAFASSSSTTNATSAPGASPHATAQDGHSSTTQHADAEQEPAGAAAEEQASAEEEAAYVELPQPEPVLEATLAQQDGYQQESPSTATEQEQAATRFDATAEQQQLEAVHAATSPEAQQQVQVQAQQPFQLQPNAAPYSPMASHHSPYYVPEQPQHQPHHSYYHPYQQQQGAPSFSYAGSTACGSSVMSGSFHKDQNSVTIKADTKVKDAAGAIAKVLDRLCSTLVTALQQPFHSAFPTTPNHHHHHHHHHQDQQHVSQHEALNRAVKALAVCRKYITDAAPRGSGVELGFLPVNRSDAWGRPDPSLFSFLAFKSVVQPGYQAPSHQAQAQLPPPPTSSVAPSSDVAASPTATSSSSITATPSSPEQHSAASASSSDAVVASAPAPALAVAAMVPAVAAEELHVSSNSDPATVANNLVRAVLEQGQAVMKAGGGNALFVAMSAVVQARSCLKAWHAMDILLVPQWITEDTRATLGRESKFVQFNVLPSGLHGVLGDASWQPAIVAMQAPPAAAAPSPAFA